MTGNARTSTDSSIAQDNRGLIRVFTEALDNDPNVDLLTLIPESYREKHRDLLRANLPSEAARYNEKIIEHIRWLFDDNPEVDLYAEFPSNYRRVKKFKKHVLNQKAEPLPLKVPTFRDMLKERNPQELLIVYPLASNVEDVLARYTKTKDSTDIKPSLAEALQQMILTSPVLWEQNHRGVVIRCDEEIVAKVLMGNNDYTEYTSMQYLLKHAADIPAPRPLGLVNMGPYRIIFMSYVPSITLTQAWPRLATEHKISVQLQLDEILRRLRSIKKDKDLPLGGVDGEGVKHFRVAEYTRKGIDTTDDFENYRFSVPHYGSNSYVKFLRSFLPQSSRDSVFTHGDFRPDNIMAHIEHDGFCSIKGIIDWEDAGFYPDYHESLMATRTMSLVEEQGDWYFYLPQSIAPSNYSVRWLVDRLWDHHIRTT